MEEGAGGLDWTEEYDGQLQVHAVAGKRKYRSRAPRKLEFVGWGSRPLIEFLQSIGTDTTNPISQYDATAILNKYVSEHSLLHPTRKKRVVCDQSLFPIFAKKTICRNRIYDLLNAHFAENQHHSDDFSDASDEDGPQHQSERKTQQYKKPPEEVPQPPKSCFAAIIPDNIKLVYLKRSLIEDLLKEKDKDPQLFERKLVGSFVRIKSDPNDYLQKNSHMLVQVIGLKKASGTDDKNADILFEVTNFVKDVRTSMLSDDNFSEDECKDLSRRITEGVFKRLTTVQLEEKVKVLHEDITKHWLSGELLMLQKLIDRANLKGWRKEMSEYLERRDLLQTAEEQQRRLHEVPKVIADEIEVKATTLDLPVIMNQEDDTSPKSTLSEASEIPFCHTAAKKTSSTWIAFGTKTADGGNSRVKEQQKIPTSIQSKSSARPPAAKIEEKKLSQVVINPPVLDSRNDALAREQQKQHPTSIQGRMSSNGGMSPAGTEEKKLSHVVINPPVLDSRNDALVREQQKQYPTSIPSWMSSNGGMSLAGTEENKSSGRPPAAVIEEKKLSQAVIHPPVLDSRNDALVRERQKQYPTSIPSWMTSNGGMSLAGSEENKSSGRPRAAVIEEKKLSQVVINPPILDSRNDALVREQQKQYPTSIPSWMTSNGGMSLAGSEENKSSGRPRAAVIEEKKLSQVVINPPILDSRNDALVREQQKQYPTSIPSWMTSNGGMSLAGSEENKSSGRPLAAVIEEKKLSQVVLDTLGNASLVREQQNQHTTSIQGGMSSNAGMSPAGTEDNKRSGRPPAAVIEGNNLFQALINPPRNDALVREQQKQHPTSIQTRMTSNGGLPHAGTEENKHSQPMMAAPAAAVIDLSDDEEDEDPVQILEYDPVNHMWHYMDPQGHVQGPFSITSLKRWKDNAYFPPDFKVWKMGQNPAEAVLLNDILDKLYLS